MNKSVVVIGAGASGLIAAGFLAQRGARVHVLEKMQRTAAKVRISGKGRCNITNAMPIEEFVDHYPSNGRFLYGALNRFSNQDCMDFFRDLGVKVKVERGHRVFPESNDAHEVADALERFAIGHGAFLHLRHKALTVERTPSGQVAGVKSLHNDKEHFHKADAVVVATGGLSYPGTGSTGDGLIIARTLGHRIIEPRAALVPLRVEEKWVRDLSGLSLRNVELTAANPSGGSESYFGELMFAHFGLTGPIVLTASEHIGLWLKASKVAVRAFIDLKPALTDQQLDQRLVRDFQKFSRKQFANSLVDLLPKSLIPILVQLSEIPSDKACHQITKQERSSLGQLLKKLPLTITKTLPISAGIVTAGGIDVDEVNPRTMESKKVGGVFYCGEVLDIHGITGGFNLQAAFSTGFCAAQGVELS